MWTPDLESGLHMEDSRCFGLERWIRDGARLGRVLGGPKRARGKEGIR